MRRVVAVAVAAVLLGAPAAGADTALLLTSSNTILRFDTFAPGSVTRHAVTGVTEGESLRGIDFRPATGSLYGWGIATGSASAQTSTYTIETAGFGGVLVGQTATNLVADTPAGFAFDPVIDRVRRIDNLDRNARLRPDGTAVATGDTPLPAASDVVAVAYDRSFMSSTLSTAFAIDRATGTLVRVGSIDGYPSATRGQVTTVGGLGTLPKGDADAGFDIAADGRAFAALTDGAGITRLFAVDLSSGASSSLGTIGTGADAAVALALVPGTEILPPLPAPAPIPAAKDTKAPVGLIDPPAGFGLRRLRASGASLDLWVSEACTATVNVLAGKTSIAKGTATAKKAGVSKPKLKLTSAGRARLRGARSITITIRVSLRDIPGNTGTLRRTITLR